jgi:hypothetical protein
MRASQNYFLECQISRPISQPVYHPVQSHMHYQEGYKIEHISRKKDLRNDLFPVTVRLEFVMELATEIGV